MCQHPSKGCSPLKMLHNTQPPEPLETGSDRSHTHTHTHSCPNRTLKHIIRLAANGNGCPVWPVMIFVFAEMFLHLLPCQCSCCTVPAPLVYIRGRFWIKLHSVWAKSCPACCVCFFRDPFGSIADKVELLSISLKASLFSLFAI